MIDLENVKVYSTDKRVAIKLAELLGVRFNDMCDNYEGEIVGVACTDDEPDEVSYFSDDSECHLAMKNEITVEQINKMHAEKFGQVESPEEKEDLDMIDTTSKQAESLAKGDVVEWKNGDKCITGSGEKIYIAPYPFEKDIHILADEQCVHRAHISAIRKPESPEQKAERERDEKAKQIMIDICGDEVFKSRDWDYHKRFSHNAKMAFQLVDLGYRKEK